MGSGSGQGCVVVLVAQPGAGVKLDGEEGLGQKKHRRTNSLKHIEFWTYVLGLLLQRSPH